MLTKESWRLVISDRTLLWFPVIGALADLVVAGVFADGGIALRAGISDETTPRRLCLVS